MLLSLLLKEILHVDFSVDVQYEMDSIIKSDGSRIPFPTVIFTLEAHEILKDIVTHMRLRRGVLPLRECCERGLFLFEPESYRFSISVNDVGVPCIEAVVLHETAEDAGQKYCIELTETEYAAVRGIIDRECWTVFRKSAGDLMQDAADAGKYAQSSDSTC